MLTRLARLSPRQQYGLSVLLGACAALAYAPLHLFFAPFIGFPIWLNLMEANQEQSWKRTFALGWWFALGYFLVGLYWITFALGADLASFWWLIPISLFGFPVALGVYVGVMSVLLQLTNSTGLARCFWFAALWTTAEIAWGTGPLALPWNPIGSIWSGFDPMFQALSVVGIYGLSLLTALAVSFPILLRRGEIKAPQIAFMGCVVLALATTTAWGIVRPTHTPVQTKEHLPIIRIVQPNVPQDMDWQPEKARAQFFDLIQLSTLPAEQRPDIIIWPESALPLLLAEDPKARAIIAQVLKPNGYLISGSLRRQPVPGERSKVFNSLMAVDAKGDVAATYDKHHLVPFGEYLPFRNIIPKSVTKITAGEFDYSRGPGLETISLDSAPSFSPLICFEGIFSAQVVAYGKPRPEWLLNITNDGWYGKSSGPYQHLQLARMRSIEEGLPLVRAANTGISVVFDAFGQEVGREELRVKGVLDARLPPALQDSTIFAKYGQVLFLLLMSLCVGLAFILRK
jgi:apolipoprotein N-acyltransferase